MTNLRGQFGKSKFIKENIDETVFMFALLSVGSLIKEEIENKKVAFIPTASLREGYTGYVGSARKLFKKLGAIVTEIDISTELIQRYSLFLKMRM